MRFKIIYLRFDAHAPGGSDGRCGSCLILARSDWRRARRHDDAAMMMPRDELAPILMGAGASD